MRDVVAWMFIGLNGRGKTTMLKEFIRHYKKAKPRNKVIVFDQNESIEKSLYNQALNLDNYERLLTTQRNTLFVIDDYKMIFTQDRPEKFWHTFFGTRRTRNNDIIFTCHAPSQVMNFLAGYIEEYFLWYTISATSIDKKIACASLIMEAKEHVDKEAKKYTKEQYINLYPNFPYAIIETLDEKITYHNFQEK